MQSSIPEVAETAGEPQHILDMYGPDAGKPGSFAANCLLARRLLERDVRCVQLFHQGWDQHGNLPAAISRQCREVDQASAALVLDLKQRGLLDDTLVVWGGEFGRTAYSQGKLTDKNYAATITPAASPCGSPAAVYVAGQRTARPTNTPTTSSIGLSTSTTSTRHSCTS